MPDPYEVLGIARDASLQEAKAAYRRLACCSTPIGWRACAPRSGRRASAACVMPPTRCGR